MKERDFQKLFSAWVKVNDDFRSSVFELKFVNTENKKSLHPIRDFQPHQLYALWKAKHKCVYHKISDQSMGYKPFDCFKICNVPAYVCVMFYKPRQEKKFIMVDIDDFQKLMKTHKKPYFSEEVLLSTGVEYSLLT